MHIKTLILTHYRGASHLEVNLHSTLNVFCGANGSGKSTLLDAIAIMLSWTVSRIGHAGTSGRPIQEKDISNGQSVASIELVCEADNQSIDWKLVKSRKGHASADEHTVLSNLNDYTKQLQSQISAKNEQVNLPLFVYYPVNRTVMDIPLRIKATHSFNLLAAYEDALSSGVNFRTFFEWFRQREDLENEIIRDQRQQSIPPEVMKELEGIVTDIFPDSQLKAVRSAIEQLIPQFKNLTVRRNPLRMEVEKNGKRLTVNQLSDGEKCLIAMIGDLARRMAIANPVRDNPLEGQGVILIDEIDLHLHPTWQRMIIPELANVFPNCQFIISTHSPHVITHVQPENIYLLEQTDQGLATEKPNESYGKTVDRVLEDLMGLKTTRPDPVKVKLDNIYVAINQGQLIEAHEKIKALQTEIGKDPELVKAEVLIRRKEIIGK